MLALYSTTCLCCQGSSPCAARLCRPQVLASDEITGSLRKIKPTAMLAKDRWGVR